MMHTCNISTRVFCTLLAFATCSCASILRSSTPNQLQITSEPMTAEVVIDGRVYATPVIVQLPPSKHYILQYRKPGYKTVSDTVKASVGVPWLIADMFFSLPFLGVPLIVDAASGQWYKIDEANGHQHIRLLPDSTHLSSPPHNHEEYSEKRNQALTEEPKPIVFRSESKSLKRLALRLEAGMAIPVYQVPVIPTSYSASISYTPAAWYNLALRVEYHGTAARVGVPDSKGRPFTTDVSLIALAPAAEVQVPLWRTGVYLAGSAGAMQASLEDSFYSPLLSKTIDRELASEWLACASAGGGFIFPGGKWFVDVRYTSALSALHISSTGERYTPYYTTARVGLRLQL